MTNDNMLAGLAARLEVLEAREAIRDVLYRYARGADRCDLALFKSCYWPDANDCHWFWNGNAHTVGRPFPSRARTVMACR